MDQAGALESYWPLALALSGHAAAACSDFASEILVDDSR